MSEGIHIGNIRLSKNGKGANIHIFSQFTTIFKNDDIFGTVPLAKLEEFVKEAKESGSHAKTLSIIHFELDKILAPAKGEPTKKNQKRK